MTKRTTRKPAVDMNRISESHRQQIERVVQIGAKIGLDQQRQKRDILKAISRNFDAMIDMIDGRARSAVFNALLEVATAADAKRIKQHPGYQEGEAVNLAYVASQERRNENNPQPDA